MTAGDANVDVALKVQPRRGVGWEAHTEAGRVGILPSGFHLGRMSSGREGRAPQSSLGDAKE